MTQAQAKRRESGKRVTCSENPYARSIVESWQHLQPMADTDDRSPTHRPLVFAGWGQLLSCKLLRPYGGRDEATGFNGLRCSSRPPGCAMCHCNWWLPPTLPPKAAHKVILPKLRRPDRVWLGALRRSHSGTLRAAAACGCSAAPPTAAHEMLNQVEEGSSRWRRRRRRWSAVIMGSRQRHSHLEPTCASEALE